ncbi:MAG: Mini-ribonuclease 3 [Christensenellales bacterium]|jgi:ribonuclease-3 family protein
MFMNETEDNKLVNIVSGRSMEPGEARQLSPLVLAYIGDTVHDIFVRTALALKGGRVNALHKQAIKQVSAAAQADMADRLSGALDEEESDIYRRGRNAHSGTLPKNASPRDYHMATGFEAVIGYLYLCGRDERLKELLDIAFGEDDI